MMRQRIEEAFRLVAGKDAEGKDLPLTIYNWEKLLQELKQCGLILNEDIEKINKITPCFPMTVDVFIQTLCSSSN